jgi:hypothetical protein
MSTKTRQSQNTQTRPKWVDYIEDVLGHTMYGDTWQRWLDWMAAPPPEGIGERVSDGEILEALRFVKRQKGDDVGQVSLDRLKQWIKWNRRSEITARENLTMQASDAVRIRRVKSQMERASDNSERWDIMCSNLTPGECEGVDRWACARWPGFGPPKMQPIEVDGIIYNCSGDPVDVEDRRRRWRMETARELMEKNRQNVMRKGLKHETQESAQTESQVQCESLS